MWFFYVNRASFVEEELLHVRGTMVDTLNTESYWIPTHGRRVVVFVLPVVFFGFRFRPFHKRLVCSGCKLWALLFWNLSQGVLPEPWAFNT